MAKSPTSDRSLLSFGRDKKPFSKGPPHRADRGGKQKAHYDNCETRYHNRQTDFGPTSSKKAAEATDHVEAAEETIAGEAEVTHSQKRTGQFKSHPTLTWTRSPDLSSVHPQLLLLNLDQNLAKSNKLPSGRTKRFLANSQKILDDQSVLHTVTGLEIEWLSKPSHSITIKGPTFSRTESNIINQEIKAMLDKGAIHATEPSNHARL